MKLSLVAVWYAATLQLALTLSFNSSIAPHLLLREAHAKAPRSLNYTVTNNDGPQMGSAECENPLYLLKQEQMTDMNET